MWLFNLLFSSLSQLWYVEIRISRSVSVSPLEFEITRVDCITIIIIIIIIIIITIIIIIIIINVYLLCYTAHLVPIIHILILPKLFQEMIHIL